MIRLQTSKGREIPNHQLSELTAFDRNWSATLPQKYTQAVFRTDSCPVYNCHGLTFGSRRTRIPDMESVQMILEDDAYVEITNPHDVIPGDIIIYVGNDGDFTHSGIVVEVDRMLHVPRICSKWGGGPEVVHLLADVPPVYGSTHRYYRCKL